MSLTILLEFIICEPPLASAVKVVRIYTRVFVRDLRFIRFLKKKSTEILNENGHNFFLHSFSVQLTLS